jgi:hypothetical protein
MNNNKPNKSVVLVLGVIGALLALSVILRFVVLSESGVGSVFYFGLPIGGIVAFTLLLMRLGLLNFGDRPSPTIQGWQHRDPAPTSQRLEELETLRASGTISDAEHTVERQRIISGG